MYCSRCGQFNPPHIRECANCGQTMPATGFIQKSSTPKVVPIIIAVMIVFFFFSIMVAIAVPGFIKARSEARKRACQENLMKIDGAKQQFALDANKAGDDLPNWNDLIKSNRPGYLNHKPVCPEGGNYSLNTIDENPTCTNHGNPLTW